MPIRHAPLAVLLVTMGFVVVSAAQEAADEAPVIWHLLRSSDSQTEHLYRFSIPRRADGTPPKSIAAWLAPTDIHQLQMVDDRLVVLGGIAGSANTVTVLDVRRPETHATFLCWQPVLSPSKRVVLYVGFYPRSSDHLRSSAVVGYFRVLGPLEAAPGGEVVSRAYPLSNLGRPVYPRTNAGLRSFERGVDGVYHNAFINAKLVSWLPADRGVVFIDVAEPASGEKVASVVAVVFASDYGEPRIEERQLELGQRDLLSATGLDGIELDGATSNAVIRLRDGETIRVALPSDLLQIE